MGICLLWATRVHEYMATYKKLRASHILKELEVCHFGKT